MSDQSSPKLHRDGSPSLLVIDSARFTASVQRLARAAGAPDSEAAVLRLLDAYLRALSPFHQILFLRAHLWGALRAWCVPAVRALLRAGGRIWVLREHGGAMVQDYVEPVWNVGILTERTYPTLNPGMSLYYINLREPRGSWYEICRRSGLCAGWSFPMSPRLAVAAILEAGAPTEPLFACAKIGLNHALTYLKYRFGCEDGVEYMGRFLFWSEQLYARAPGRAGLNIESAISGLRALEGPTPKAEVARQEFVSQAEALLCTLTAWSVLRRSWAAAVARAIARR